MKPLAVFILLLKLFISINPPNKELFEALQFRIITSLLNSYIANIFSAEVNIYSLP